jgi:hypothetical protein
MFSRAWLSRDPNEYTDPNLVDPNAIANWNPLCNLDYTGNSEYAIDLADLCVFLDDWLWSACWKLDEINAAATTATAQTESSMIESLSATRSLSAAALDATSEMAEIEPDVSAETLVQIIGFLNEAVCRMGESVFLSPMLYFSFFANKHSIQFFLHIRKIGFRISARFDIFMIRRPRPVRKVFHQFMLYGVIMDIIHMTLQIFPVANPMFPESSLPNPSLALFLP